MTAISWTPILCRALDSSLDNSADAFECSNACKSAQAAHEPIVGSAVEFTDRLICKTASTTFPPVPVLQLHDTHCRAVQAASSWHYRPRGVCLIAHVILLQNRCPCIDSDQHRPSSTTRPNSAPTLRGSSGSKSASERSLMLRGLDMLRCLSSVYSKLAACRQTRHTLQACVL